MPWPLATSSSKFKYCMWAEHITRNQLYTGLYLSNSLIHFLVEINVFVFFLCRTKWKNLSSEKDSEKRIDVKPEPELPVTPEPQRPPLPLSSAWITAG